MADRSIVIIGAGVAGLAAGCYARMNGYAARVLEMHSVPGGLCTAWKRQGFTVDGCVHWLVGSSPRSAFHGIWRELGAVQGRSFVDHDEYLRIEGRDGRTLVLYADVDRLERHLLDLSPADAKVIRSFTRAVRALSGLEMPIEKAPETMGAVDGLRMMASLAPRLPAIVRWAKVSLREFAGRFTDPLLREGFLQAWIPEFSMLFVLMTFAWLNDRVAGYPLGGSLPFALAIERRLKALGGAVEYGARVERILVEGGRAVGVRLADGTERRADAVISAADGHATTFDLLGGAFLDDAIRARYARAPIFEPLALVSLGVRRTFADLPPSVSGLSIPLDAPIDVAGAAIDRLHVQVYSFDPSLAPPGCTTLQSLIPTAHEPWRRLHDDRAAYDAAKARLADAVVAALDRRFPGLAGQVAMRDVATPLTFARYTGNWQGSFEGWLMTPANWKDRIPKTLPGLSGLYLCGQWVEPGGGLPAVAMSGRHVVQIACKADGRRFTASTP